MANSAYTKTSNMTNGSPSGGNFFRGVDVLSMLGCVAALGLGEKEIGYIFSTPMDNKIMLQKSVNTPPCSNSTTSAAITSLIHN
jgi:hypothetical protein